MAVLAAVASLALPLSAQPNGPVEAWSGRLEIQRMAGPCPTAAPSQVPVQFAWARSDKSIEGYLADDVPRARRVRGASLATLAIEDPEYRYLQLDGALALSDEGTALSGTLRGPADAAGCTVAEARLELRREADAGAAERLQRLRHLFELGRAALDGSSAERKGRWEEALRRHRDALDGRVAALGARHQDAIRSRINVGHSLVQLGRLAEAEPVAREALETARTALGERHPDALIALRNLAAVLHAQGRHVEAVPLRAAHHAAVASSAGEGSPAAIQSAHEWGYELDRAGRPGEALPLNQRNAENALAALGEAHRSTLWALHNVAANLADMGRANEALALNRRVGAVRAREFGEADPDTLWSRYVEARNLLALKRTDEAAGLLESVAAGRDKAVGPAAADTLWARRELAVARRQQARYADALEIDRAIHETRVRVLGADHADTLSALVDVGLDLRLLGRAADAVRTGEDAAARAERGLGRDHPTTLWAVHTLGYSYDAAARPADRLTAAQRVLEGRRRRHGDDHPLTLDAMEALAHAHMGLYQYDVAVPLLEQLVAGYRRVAGAAHPTTLRLLGVRGALLGYIEGRAAEGLAQVEAVWRQVEANPALPEDWRLDHAKQLAFAYGVAGRHEDEARLREWIAAASRRLYGETHPETLVAMGDHASVLAHVGAPARAQAIARQATEDAVREFGIGSAVADRLLTTRMAIEARVGASLAERDRTITALVESAERRRLAGEASDEARRAFFQPYSRMMIQHAAELAGDGRIEYAFELFERAKARTLLDSLSLRRADETAGLVEADRERLRVLEERRASLDEKLAAAAAADRNAVRAERDEAVRLLAAFRRDLERRYPRYARLREVRLATARDGMALLADDQALVSYVWVTDMRWATDERGAMRDGAPRRLGAFVLTRDGLRYADLGTGSEIERLAHALRALVSRVPGQARKLVWQLPDGHFVASETPPAGASEALEPRLVADTLAALVLQPLQPLLEGRRRIVVSPAGPLTLVPFEVLPLDGEPLVARHDVSYVQSLSVLRLLQEREREMRGRDERRQLFAMGAPVYEAPRAPAATRADVGAARNLATRAAPGDVTRAFGALRLSWSELPGAAREVADVAALFPEASRTTLLRANASEARLRELDRSGELAKYRYLHFAAHGYLSTQVPALSSLVLSQVGNAPDSDGYVTAAEWTAFNLASDLIVLSACDTGVGEVVQGEGVMGLPYALFAAGNRNTLLTLWPIVDATTAEFMKKFFARLAKGEPQARALAETKREFLAGPLARPVFWAGFVLYGN